MVEALYNVRCKDKKQNLLFFQEPYYFSNDYQIIKSEL